MTDTLQERVRDSDSNLVRHADRELTILGMGPDSGDINRMMREAILELVLVFSAQGHSGASAAYCLGTTRTLLEFRNIAPLTDDPDDWMEVGPQVWQCRRNSEAFSEDGGKTYTLLSEKEKLGSDLAPLHRSLTTTQLEAWLRDPEPAP